MGKVKINFSFIVIIVVAMLSIVMVALIFNNRIKSIEKKAGIPGKTHP